MATPTMTFRIPAQLQKTAKEKAKNMGIPLSLIIQKTLETFIHTRSITLTENGFTPEFEETILKSQTDTSSPSFSNAKDAINYLHSL